MTSHRQLDGLHEELHAGYTRLAALALGQLKYSLIFLMNFTKKRYSDFDFRMHLLRFTWRPAWFLDDTVLKREGSTSQGRKLTYQALELGSNTLPVTLVAACT